MKMIKRFFFFWGFFYYSQNQQDIDYYDNDCNVTHYFQNIFGKVLPYTEMVTGYPFKPISKWDDLKFAGFGRIHHIHNNRTGVNNYFMKGK
jgi:hypothetical protein